MPPQRTYRTYKWCPNGCGKRVLFVKLHPIIPNYECIECGTKFHREELECMNSMTWHAASRHRRGEG